MANAMTKPRIRPSIGFSTGSLDSRAGASGQLGVQAHVQTGDFEHWQGIVQSAQGRCSGANSRTLSASRFRRRSSRVALSTEGEAIFMLRAWEMRH
ncbi:MAG: hypothetical protein EXQ88_06975 [Alphaproteobacteria bacterium]|nr:hypothetical protein [Alphaproteobacteria bacterium]